MYSIDGQKIEHGMRVWTKDLQKGTVDLNASSEEGWFEVVLDNGFRTSLNGDRVIVYHPCTMERA